MRWRKNQEKHNLKPELQGGGGDWGVWRTSGVQQMRHLTEDPYIAEVNGKTHVLSLILVEPLLLMSASTLAPTSEADGSQEIVCTP